MAADRRRKKLNIRRMASAEPMPVTDWQAAERILAKMVARAYAADHTELFGAHLDSVLGKEISGPVSAVRTDAVRPPRRTARGGGPESKWSVEHYDKGARRT